MHKTTTTIICQINIQYHDFIFELCMLNELYYIAVEKVLRMDVQSSRKVAAFSDVKKVIFEVCRG